MADIAVPLELSVVGQPLHDAGLVLQSLADERPRLEQLGDAAVSPRLREAVRAFLEAYELSTWTLGDELVRLGADLEMANEYYTYVDRQLSYRFHGSLRPQ